MRRVLERRADRDHDPLLRHQLLVRGGGRKRRALLGQALDDHRRHLADVAEHLLARGAPGGGAVGQQRRAVAVPHAVLGLEDGREGVGAQLAAHGASVPPAGLARPSETAGRAAPATGRGPPDRSRASSRPSPRPALPWACACSRDASRRRFRTGDARGALAPRQPWSRRGPASGVPTVVRERAAGRSPLPRRRGRGADSPPGGRRGPSYPGADGAVRPETSLQPSPEQLALIAARRADPAGSLRVLAFAGSGKTTALRLLAEAGPSPALYLAYNKSAQLEAQRRFPAHVACRTVHSLAYRATGMAAQRHRLERRLAAREAAEMLVIPALDGLRPSFRAHCAVAAVRAFTHSAAGEIDAGHLPALPRGTDRAG